jgi:hypothetical protein
MLASAGPSVGQDSPAARASAEATAPPSESATKAKFAEALRLYKGRKVAEALPLFRELAESTRSPNAQLYVGYCLSDLGKRLDAYNTFTATLRNIAERSEADYESTREAAEGQLALLNVRLSKVVIAVVEPPPGFAVTLDGAAVEEKAWGSSIVVEPGAHHLDAAGTGVKPVRMEFYLDAGQLKAVNLVPKQADDGEARAAHAPRPASAPRAARPMRTAGYVAGAAGIVGLGVFTVAGLMAKSTYDTLSRECGAAGCSDAGHRSDIDRGQSLQTVAGVGLVVGLVGVAAGSTLLLVGSKKHDDAGVAMSWSSQGGMVSYRGEF